MGIILVQNQDYCQYVIDNILIKNNIDQCLVITPSQFSAEIYKKAINNINIKVISTYDMQSQFDICSLERRYAELTRIILSYNGDSLRGKNISISDAIQMSVSLDSLYHEIDNSVVDIEKIIGWVDEDLAQHWWDTADFLQYVMQCYQKFLLANAPTTIEDMINLFIAQNDINRVFCVGMAPKFLQNNAKIDIFLPPEYSTSISNDIFNRINNENICNLQAIREVVNTSSINKMQRDIPKLYELNDIFAESSHIIELVKEHMMNSSDEHKIGILCSNTFLAEICASKLRACKIDCYNVIKSVTGIDYANIQEIELFLALAKFKVSNGNISDFFDVIQSKVLQSIFNDINNNIRNQKIILNNFIDVYTIFCNMNVDNEVQVKIMQELNAWLNIKCQNIIKNVEENVMTLNNILLFSKKYEENGVGIRLVLDCVNAIKFIAHDQENCEISALDKYNEVLRMYFRYWCDKSALRDYASNENIESCSVYILSPDEAVMHDWTLVILADFNTKSWPLEQKDDVWIGDIIRKKLNMTNNASNFKHYEQIYSRLLACKKVAITRSKYTSGVVNSISSLIEN